MPHHIQGHAIIPSDRAKAALWPTSTVPPVKHNGRSRVYRVSFASCSAPDACRKVDGPCQSCHRGGGLTRTGRSRQRDRAPIAPPGIA